MDEEMFQLHLEAGRAYGREATCGSKVDYKSDESAERAAARMNDSGKARHMLEAYPCYWCQGWHIGRAMSRQELLVAAGLHER